MRLVIKTDNVTNELLKSLNSIFGALIFCSSTIHFIPDTKEAELKSLMANPINAKEIMVGLSKIDVVLYNKCEQSLAMVRMNLAKSARPMTTVVDDILPTGSLLATRKPSIFDRLEPRHLSHSRVAKPKPARNRR